MKKLLSPLFLIILLVVSFYYTNKSVSILRNIDPIMKEIKSTEEKYTIDPVDAIINSNEITSGKNGKTINYDESYNKMKRYGTYNEALTTLKEIEPSTSINNNYDKYIVGGNKSNHSISIIIKLTNNKNINKTLKVLENKQVPVTFFIDGIYLENNFNTVKNLTNHEVEILSYNNSYKEQFLKTSISYLESITNQKVKYCYTEKNNSKVLDTCKKLKLHTVKPTLVLSNNIYSGIKNKLDNSIIIAFNYNSYVEKELPVVIDYIKKKGYKLTTLDNLLKEDN